MNVRRFIGTGRGESALYGLIIGLSALLGCHSQRNGDRSFTTSQPPPPVAKSAPNSSPTPKPVQTSATEASGPWRSLFDGKTLTGWAETDFAGHGEVKVSEGKLILETGVMTGVTWTNAPALPRINYEIALD